MAEETKAPAGLSRRSFVQGSSAALYGAALLGRSPRAEAKSASALGDAEITIALVGCGGRGTGAAKQALDTQGKVRLVAMADAFRDRLDQCHDRLDKEVGDRVDVPEENKYAGFDAYRKAISSGADVVILATPPGFRPEHFEYAVAEGKHIFMEKPVAVDAPGIRRVLRVAKAAKERNLKVGVGLQRHHDPAYLDTMARVHDGAIGEVTALRVYWNSAGVWVRPRKAEQTEMEYQMRNWYYFNWLCGDHIVEQHIHNLDVGNWVMQDYPVAAQGQGGRQVRDGKDHGEIYDHHFVEFTYASGATMLSQCRHIKGCWDHVGEHAHGTHGHAELSAAKLRSRGGWSWRHAEEPENPYQLEHDHLFEAIRKDQPFNEAANGAKSTLTSILGRMATYSGQRVTWEQAMESELDLSPQEYRWDAPPPSLPDENGHYAIAVPGETRAF